MVGVGTLIEAYWMDGRVAMTSAVGRARAPDHEETTGIRGGSMVAQAKVVATVDATLTAATAWEMQSIWVSKEQVLATPRADK